MECYKTKDMGDIERRLNLKFLSFESDNAARQALYTWVGPHQKARAQKVMDGVLKQDPKELGTVRALLRF